MGEATPAAGERDGPGQLSPSSSALAVTSHTRTITSFNSASVRRSAVIVFAIAGALLLSLWLFEVTRHFSFLVVLAWLFAIALEPGFRELVAHGRSRGIATTLMGGGAILTTLLLAGVSGQLFFNQITEFVTTVPTLAIHVIERVNGRFDTTLGTTTITSSLNLTPSWVRASSPRSRAGCRHMPRGCS